MIGRKIATAPSIIARVSLLEEASHTVRLALGLAEDGSRKGNKAAPAVAIVPAGTSADAKNAMMGCLRRNTAPAAPTSAVVTATHNHTPVCEFANQLPSVRRTAFVMGLEGPSW